MQDKNKFDKLSIINVKNKLGLKEVCSKGKIIYAKCPFCHSKNADLKLNTENNTFICKNCEEAGSSVSLYARCHFLMTNRKAFIELMNMDADMATNISNISNNSKKDVTELDEIYTEFLSLIKLSDNHKKYLNSLGFSDERIKEIGFKSIPVNENIKLKICDRLIELGYDLRGVPGFFQNEKFKWTFKSHNGFFIPVRNNLKIEALRIHLDNKYKNDTTDIWFSSRSEYNGSMINNVVMVLKPEIFKLMAVGKEDKNKQIIVVTDILFAYVLSIIFKDMIIVGIPSYISKNEIRKLSSIGDVDKVSLILDYHAALHNSFAIINNLKNIYSGDKIEVDFSIKDFEIPDNIKKNFIKNEEFKDNVSLSA